MSFLSRQRRRELVVLPEEGVGGQARRHGLLGVLDGWRGRLSRRDGDSSLAPGPWGAYQPAEAYDELFASRGHPRPSAQPIFDDLAGLTVEDFRARQDAAELTIKTTGITFTVYSEGENIDRAWPFDIFPRVLAESEWRRVEQGLEQRLTALNAFVSDVYGDQKIFRDGAVPRDLLAGSQNLREQCVGACRALASGRTSAAPTSSATATAPSTSSRTTSASPRACRTCSRTAR